MSLIINNFLPQEDYKLLHNWFHKTGTLSWCLETSTLCEQNDNKFMFVQKVEMSEYMSNPNWLKFWDRLAKHIGQIERISRVKVNLYTNQGKIIEHTPHIDRIGDSFPKGRGFTAVMNLTTCNGYTVLKEKETKKILSKENDLIVFDTGTVHYGAVQDDEPFRIVININGDTIKNHNLGN